MRKHHKKQHATKRRISGHRRHRMGALGMGQDTLMEIAGLVVASIGGTIAQKQLTTINPKIVSAAEVAAGVYLKNSAGSAFMRGMGWGLLSTGSIGLFHEFGVIRGLDDLVSGMTGEGGGYIEGIRNDQFIAGLANEVHVGAAEVEDMPHHTKSLADIFHAEGLNG